MKMYILFKKIKEDAIIPTPSNHTLGVGAVVINEKKKKMSF